MRALLVRALSFWWRKCKTFLRYHCVLHSGRVKSLTAGKRLNIIILKKTMALTGWNFILKCIVLIFNLFFWLAGVGILSIAVWLRIEYATYVKVHDDLQTYYTGTYILMGTGTVMTLIGFFGCCGACRESQCMLGTFFTLLLIIFAVEVAAAIWMYVHKDKLRDMVKENLKYTVEKEYSVVKSKTEAVDRIQKELGCCGASGYYDWADAVLTTGEEIIKKNSFNADFSRSIGADERKNFYVPRSCCKPTEQPCSEKFLISATSVAAIYPDGCADKLEEQLQDKIGVISGIGIGITVIEVLGMIFSLILCCALRRERFKI